MSPALPDPAVASAQREDVARPSEVRGGWGGRGERAAGEGAVVGGDAGCEGGVGGVDGEGVGGAVGVGVFEDHLWEGEGVGEGGGDGGADEAAGGVSVGMAGEENSPGEEREGGEGRRREGKKEGGGGGMATLYA